jgi:hypothetical protein
MAVRSSGGRERRVVGSMLVKLRWWVKVGLEGMGRFCGMRIE